MEKNIHHLEKYNNPDISYKIVLLRMSPNIIIMRMNLQLDVVMVS